MTSFLIWLEATALSIWVRESISVFAFPMILAYHTIGLGFLVGLNAAIDLRILGVARGVPLAKMRSFLPIAWAGFWLNVVSGLLLFMAYPTKALFNPLFYIKLALVTAAVLLLRRISQTVFRDPEFQETAIPQNLRRLAIASLACWALTIAAGRFLAYTYTYLTAYELQR